MKTPHPAPAPSSSLDPAAPSLPDLATYWIIFPIGQDNPISLRALSPPGAADPLHTINLTFTACNYPQLNDRKLAFQQAATNLNDKGYNIYIVMNPIKPEFAGDEQNRCAVSDKDIACRRRLLVDIDRVAPLGAPATDAEVAEAGAVADAIETYLLCTFGTEVFRVMSGNGHHLYVPLDELPNDPASKTLCSGLLNALGRQFNTATMKVDQTVSNASRSRRAARCRRRPLRSSIVKSARQRLRDLVAAVPTLSASSAKKVSRQSHEV